MGLFERPNTPEGKEQVKVMFDSEILTALIMPARGMEVKHKGLVT